MLAREAVAIADDTGFINAQGGAYVSLGDVLSAGGKKDEARVAFEQALARYERKRNLVMEERVRKRLTTLNEPVPA